MVASVKKVSISFISCNINVFMHSYPIGGSRPDDLTFYRETFSYTNVRN